MPNENDEKLMEGYVHTVLGAVPKEKIGFTDCHEHLFIQGGMPVLHFPDFKLVDYERISEDVSAFIKAGGNTIVEMSPLDWGRDVNRMVRLSKELGVHVIAATGFHKLFYYSDIHWLYLYSEDELVTLICDELTKGMDIYNYSGPKIKRAAATAGVIKIGTQIKKISDTEKKLLRVAARSHLLTGAPIITHTDEGELALEQILYLSECGVSPNRIAISHIDRRLDLSYHKELAKTGAYLEYDSLTRIKKGFDISTLNLITSMVEAGFGSKLLIGGDISRQSYWRSYGGEPGLAFLVDEFYTRLADAGLSETEIYAIYVDNPRSLLVWSH